MCVWISGVGVMAARLPMACLGYKHMYIHTRIYLDSIYSIAIKLITCVFKKTNIIYILCSFLGFIGWQWWRFKRKRNNK